MLHKKCFVLDLDGTVYLGDIPIQGTVDFILRHHNDTDFYYQQHVQGSGDLRQQADPNGNSGQTGAIPLSGYPSGGSSASQLDPYRLPCRKPGFRHLSERTDAGTHCP